MAKAVNNFAHSAEPKLAVVERGLRRFLPSLDQVTKQFLTVASAAAVAGLIISGIRFTTQQIASFDKGLASFRTIVSDLNDSDFSKYKTEIFKVANDTRQSSVKVVGAFEKIAGLNSEFAKTAEGLGAVSKASITLAKASNSELEPAAESLVEIMNQYGAAALEADRYINVLAAGQAVGAASINDLGESFKNVGSTLKGANATIEQGTALLEVLGNKGLKGAEAGTKLRGVILKLQQAGVGYKSGQFQIADALDQVKKKFETLRRAKDQDAYLNKVFGAENISAGRTLLTNIDLYNQYTAAVTGTTEAQKAAEINSNTLANRIDELKSKWVNLVTGNENATKSLNIIKTVLKFVTDHLEGIVLVGSIVAGTWLSIWSIVKLGQGVIKTITTLQWLWNVAMAANPAVLIIAAIIVGLTALSAMIYLVVKDTKGWGEQWDTTKKFIMHGLEAIKLTFMLAWNKIQDGFLTMVDTIVLAWKWGQNKIGAISDEQYAQDVARIKEAQKLRAAGIQENKIALLKALSEADKAFAWKVQRKDANDYKAMQWEEDQVPFPERIYPELAPKSKANDEILGKLYGLFQNQKLQIDINDPSGKATVGKTTPNLKPRVTSTLAAPPQY